MSRPLLHGPPRVVSLGLDLFARTLEALDTPVVHLAWTPPCGGDPRLAALLAMLNTCASGVAVVNIDNGFGAGYMASVILRGTTRARSRRGGP